MSGHEDAVRELATAYGIAVEYWDWQGQHVARGRRHDGRGAGRTRRRREHRGRGPRRCRREGRRGLAADAAAGAGDPPGLAARRSTCTSPTALGRRRLDRAGDRRAPGGVAQHENWDPPRTVDGELVGEATFAIPGDLPLGYHRLHAHSGDRQAADDA